MKFKHACSRTEPPGGGASLEELVSPDNEVRFIDAFVDSLPLEQLGFRTDFPENGRPAYHPTILLKLLVYGYLNRIRSSRCLERECHRNIEVMWLLGQLAPDHNTIANFRKHNAKAITKVFRATVKMARHFDLVGGELLAGDSTKLRAQNSKKNKTTGARSPATSLTSKRGSRIASCPWGRQTRPARQSSFWMPWPAMRCGASITCSFCNSSSTLARTRSLPQTRRAGR